MRVRRMWIIPAIALLAVLLIAVMWMLSGRTDRESLQRRLDQSVEDVRRQLAATGATEAQRLIHERIIKALESTRVEDLAQPRIAVAARINAEDDLLIEWIAARPDIAQVGIWSDGGVLHWLPAPEATVPRSGTRLRQASCITLC